MFALALFKKKQKKRKHKTPVENAPPALGLQAVDCLVCVMKCRHAFETRLIYHKLRFKRGSSKVEIFQLVDYDPHAVRI